MYKKIFTIPEKKQKISNFASSIWKLNSFIDK